MRIGTIVIDSTAAAIIAYVFVNASGANSQISALQYLRIFPLLSGNDGQEAGIKRQEDRGERKNLIVIRLDSGREPIPVSSDRREEFRKHGIAIYTNPPMNRILPLRSRGAAPSGFIEPCLPSSADRFPAGPDWIHEIKHDGSPRYLLVVEAVDRA